MTPVPFQWQGGGEMLMQKFGFPTGTLLSLRTGSHAEPPTGKGIQRRGGKPYVISYLEGQGDLVCRLITPIRTHIATLSIPVINLLTKSP